MEKIDPICGNKGTISTHGHYFCGEHCIRKYEEKQNIASNDKYCPSCDVKQGVTWYKERFAGLEFKDQRSPQVQHLCFYNPHLGGEFLCQKLKEKRELCQNMSYIKSM